MGTRLRTNLGLAWGQNPTQAFLTEAAEGVFAPWAAVAVYESLVASVK